VGDLDTMQTVVIGVVGVTPTTMILINALRR
jgi:hypothetical protein